MRLLQRHLISFCLPNEIIPYSTSLFTTTTALGNTHRDKIWRCLHYRSTTPEPSTPTRLPGISFSFGWDGLPCQAMTLCLAVFRALNINARRPAALNKMAPQRKAVRAKQSQHRLIKATSQGLIRAAAKLQADFELCRRRCDVVCYNVPICNSTPYDTACSYSSLRRISTTEAIEAGLSARWSEMIFYATIDTRVTSAEQSSLHVLK